MFSGRKLSREETFLFFFFLIFISLLCRLLVVSCTQQRGFVVACAVQVPECTVVHGLGCLTADGILAPGSGIKPMAPVLEARFVTVGPPGKSLNQYC